MGKKRIVTSSEGDVAVGAKTTAKSSRKRHSAGLLHVQSTYNNTKVMLSDMAGNILAWSSSGSLGFKGAKKGTPFAASKGPAFIAYKATHK